MRYYNSLITAVRIVSLSTVSVSMLNAFKGWLEVKLDSFY